MIDTSQSWREDVHVGLHIILAIVMEGEEKIPLATRIAALVHAHFDALPARYKPRTRDDGSREWIPMSGFVVVQGI